jgi:hypothetical protein
MEYLIEHAMKTKRRKNDKDKKIKYKLGKFVDLFCNIYIISNIYLDMKLKKECVVQFQKVHHQDNVSQFAIQDFAKKKKNYAEQV